ncbi:TRAP transporter large permease subunit [Yersinia kristensenii]|uniref:TRAP transporter large permease subunit n=1 Tax=Yersinia kristensenii TaxID=28152 RepID=UPI0038CD16CE
MPFRQALKIFVDTLWGLMTVVIIMGGILSGVFTATESAAIACLWSFFVPCLSIVITNGQSYPS